jgi:protoheme IX farnesyltransferase
LRATRKLFAFSILYLFALFAILLLEVVVRAILPLVW